MTYFLIPIFNESLNIQELSNRLRVVLASEKKHIVLVDDCSTDNTVEFIDKFFDPGNYTVLHNSQNSGPGFSFNVGFEYILSVSKDETDLIVTMEGDNTSDLDILPGMHALARQWNYDLVLSSVYAQGGGFSKTSFLRKIISLVANQIMRLVFDIKVLTLSSFYRVYKIGLVRSIKHENDQLIIRERGFICALELLIKSVRLHAKIIEVPMVLKSDNRKGKSKMKILKTSWEYSVFIMKQIGTK